jgi:uncharacterized protein YjbJ (UPF0337 family)
VSGSHRGVDRPDLIEVLTEEEMTLASSKDTPKRIEARFKRDERAQDGAQAMLEYLAEGRAVREKTARLRALRLAAEAGKKDAGVKAAAKQAKGSVKKAADKVTGGAKLKAKGKAAKAVGKVLGSKKDTLTNTLSA